MSVDVFYDANGAAKIRQRRLAFLPRLLRVISCDTASFTCGMGLRCHVVHR